MSMFDCIFSDTSHEHANKEDSTCELFSYIKTFFTNFIIYDKILVTEHSISQTRKKNNASHIYFFSGQIPRASFKYVY